MKYDAMTCILRYVISCTKHCNILPYVFIPTTYFECSMINLPSLFNGMSFLPARSRNMSGGPYMTIFAKQTSDFLSPSSALSPSSFRSNPSPSAISCKHRAIQHHRVTEIFNGNYSQSTTELAWFLTDYTYCRIIAG